MDFDSQIQIVDRYNPVTLCEAPDFLFWQQSPAGSVDLDRAEAFANRLLALIAERRQVLWLRLTSKQEGRPLDDRFR